MKGRLLAAIGRALLSLRYRVRIDGMDAILARGRKGILLLPNHPAYVDPVILLTSFYPHLAPHTLADKDNMAKPMVRWLAGRMGVRPIPDPALHGEASVAEVEQVIQRCIAELRQGENYMLYPAGRIYLSRHEDLGANSALETILSQAPDVRVVLVRTTGLWGSSFSKAVNRRPDWQHVLLRGIGALLKSFLFFAPRREVRIRVEEAPALPRDQGRLAVNRTLEAFYNADAPPARYVPYSLWEGGGVRDLPEPEVQRIEGNLADVPASVREQLRAKLAEVAGKGDAADAALLARDLGLDSLARLELQVWIERQFGHPIADPEALRTVGDCLLAASGQASGNARPPPPPPPPRWRASASLVTITEGESLTELFLRQAATDPARPALADVQGGTRSYRDVVTGILALRPRIAAMPGERIGIMLPASAAAAVAYWATLFAGKTPVMINWTAGARNIAHGLELLGVERVVSATPLVAKVESMGTDLSAVRERFWMLEEFAASLGTGAKLRAFLAARLSWRALRRVRPSPAAPAAILFTSGSEALPKAVPLTHANLVANLRDIVRVVPLGPADRMVGFLPPFHSFGLTGTVLLPLCAGLPVVYSPNPTDGAALAQIIEAYGVTMLVGTPTFLAGITRAATDAQLASLRMVVAGAEKCPASLFEAVARRWPELRVIEGYGITECSPVLSANDLAAPRPGTLGRPLPSVEHAIVDLDTGRPVAPGRAGMLLVRGPSVFEGYLGFDGPSPFVEHDGKRWYRTGDLVRADGDGSWIFEGRLKRFVKLGGEMVSLPAVEEVLLRRFGRADDREIPLAVEATPDEGRPELVLFCVRPVGREEANAALGEAGLSPLHFVRQVRQVAQIPVLGTGKTDYRALQAALS